MPSILSASYIISKESGKILESIGKLLLQAVDLSSHVEALLMAVKSANDFEAEMEHKFGAKQASSKEQDKVRFSLKSK